MSYKQSFPALWPTDSLFYMEHLCIYGELNLLLFIQNTKLKFPQMQIQLFSVFRNRVRDRRVTAASGYFNPSEISIWSGRLPVEDLWAHPAGRRLDYKSDLAWEHHEIPQKEAGCLSNLTVTTWTCISGRKWKWIIFHFTAQFYVELKCQWEWRSGVCLHISSDTVWISSSFSSDNSLWYRFIRVKQSVSSSLCAQLLTLTETQTQRSDRKFPLNRSK